ncbi:MAG: PD-(D/E)XK nuclease family protein [Methanomassiliicoccaceae archaeon]|nr:PD-(D/E)XK nuclease family protein [Methanomassiliicoccaceae archaeon]
MRPAKTIDQIYSEVKDLDIVISSDASLVTALNNRIDVPRIGRLASTPKMIAKDLEDAVLEKLMDSGRCTDDGTYGIMDDVKLLERISEITGYDIRFVHGEVENIRTIRKHTKDVYKHLNGRPSKEIYRVFAELPTYELVMDSFNPSEHRMYDGGRTAVIGIELFSDLDKHFIPAEFEEIDMFTDDGGHDIGIVYAVGNDREVAEHAADLISLINPEDAAIVMDTGGNIADAVRSALYRKGVPFKNVLTAKDIVHVRDYLEFVRKGLTYEILTVGDVRELFACYGALARSKHDEYLLSGYTRMAGDEFKELAEIMKNIREHTFSELCAKIVRDSHRGTVMMILDELDLSSLRINERTAGAASYLIGAMDGIKHNVQIPDNEKRGVLLADCRNSAFIDRPFVIFLNMDNAWAGQNTGHDYVDRAEEEEKDRLRFQVLLQQGSSRMYIVNTMKNGKDARPCILFDPLNINSGGSLSKISSFSDITNTKVIKGIWRVPDVPSEKVQRPPPASKKELEKFSKSSMSAYLSCPRAYLFSRFVGSPDSEHTVFGNMIHEFAEFCACYPDIAAENMDACIKKITDLWAGISCPERNDIDISKVRTAVTNTAKFIASLNPSLRPDAPADRDNVFFREFGCNMTSRDIEKWLDSDRTKLRGKIDLLLGRKIIDHKTGRPHPLSDIAKRMDIIGNADDPELQPFVYLSMLDDALGDQDAKEFIFFYAMDNEMESSDPGFNITRNIRRIVLLPVRRTELIRNGTISDIITRTKSRAFIKEFERRFNDALLEAGVENAASWEHDGPLFDRILSLHTKDNKGVREGIRTAIRMAAEIISRPAIHDPVNNIILIPRDSIEWFREYAIELHKKADMQQLTGLPCEPRIKCRDCDHFHMCTGGGDPDDGPE